jgi:hypothetical protein
MSARHHLIGWKREAVSSTIIFVGKGAGAETTITTLSLAEPAGCAADDVMFACIAYRIASSTPVTLGGGWALVAQQTQNNVVESNLGMTSVLLAWRRRTGIPIDPPNTHVFTFPIAPSVAIGRIVAYRGISSANSPVLNGATSSPNNQTNVDWTPFTVTTSGLSPSLAVAVVAGAQQASYTSFLSGGVTYNSGNSTNEIQRPAVNEWLERTDDQTTTGANCALAIYDASVSVSTYILNPKVTASLAAGHGLCVTAIAQNFIPNE